MSEKVSINNGKDRDRVYFFKMNGCGHCEHMKPIWGQATMIVKKSNPSVVFIEVESKDIKKLDRYTKSKLNTKDILGFPDLRIINKNGKISKFQSNRTVEELVKWIKENTGESPSPLKRVPTPYPGKIKTKRLKGGRTMKHRRSAKRRNRKSRRT
jgi:hypothetical protein